MKKLVVVLLLIGIALPVLANDALVLPQGIGRVYLVPVYGWSTGAWDDDGEFTEYEDEEGALTIFNLGIAGEYGITDQISLGIQWAPGYNIVADPDVADNPGTPDIKEDKSTIRGPNPLTIGTEVGIVGSRGWVQSDFLRVQAALGFEIPFQPNWKTQGENATSGETFVVPEQFIAAAKPLYAVGGGLSFDFVVMEGLYLNLFSEFRQHFGRTFDLTEYYQEISGLDDTYAKQELEIDPVLEMDLEFEPNYEIAVSDGLELGFGLPVTYAYTPAVTTTTTTNIELSSPGGTGGNDVSVETEGDPSWTVTLGPTVSAFITSVPAPLEFVAYWNWPVAGENSARTNQLVLESRVYFSTGAGQ